MQGAWTPSPRSCGERVGVRGAELQQAKHAQRLAATPPHPPLFAHARASTSQSKSDLSDFDQLLVPKSGEPDFGCTRGEVKKEITSAFSSRSTNSPRRAGCARGRPRSARPWSWRGADTP